MKARILSDIALVCLIAVAPWWLWMLGLLAGAIVFPFFWEGIILSALAEVLYGSSGRIAAAFPFSIAITLIVLFAGPLRERLRYNY